MSKLQDSLQEYRAAAATTSSVTAEERQSSLIVSVWQGDSWVLPWSQLLSARLSEDCLELAFAPVHVVLTGRNLRALLDDIAAFRLGSLRSLPANYGPSSDPQAPFIAKIEVRIAGRERDENS